MKIELDPSDTKGLENLKARALMLKLLCLDAMGKPVLTDVSTFNKREKVKLQLEIERRWEEPDILQKFNELCIQTIFDSNEYDKMPVISAGLPENATEVPKEAVV